jgi:putative flippase GtrA
MSSAAAVAPAPFVLGLRYLGFAVLATAANLLAQEATVRIAPAAPLLASLVMGTGVGFVAKYLLDKHLVFFDASRTHTEEARKVALYGLFSVATTLVFWAFEFGFFAIWGTAQAKYAGALVGLGLGYAVKYGLDRRFVFGPRAP